MTSARLRYREPSAAVQADAQAVQSFRRKRAGTDSWPTAERRYAAIRELAKLGRNRNEIAAKLDAD